MDKIDRKTRNQKAKSKPFLIGKELKNKRLTANRRAAGKGDSNKTQAQKPPTATKPRRGTPEADENQKDGCRIA